MKSSILPQENAVHCVPLWNPSFGFEDGKPARCVQLGDVGYFDKNGTFVSIFNIYLSEDENRQEGFLPPKFQQYPELRRILSRTIYSGSTYSGGGFEATANPQLLQKFGYVLFPKFHNTIYTSSLLNPDLLRGPSSN